MPTSPSPTSAVPTPSTTALNLDDITDIFTAGIFIEPVITNCGHVFEKVAIAKNQRIDSKCPICRAEITSAVPDDELAKKIQDQFVKINEENKKIFEDQKKTLEEDPSYAPYRGVPVTPSIPVRRSSGYDMSDADVRAVPDTTRSSRSSSYYSTSSFSSASTSDLSLSAQVQSAIRADNLLLAEQTADTISSRTFKDENYKNIANAYISKANTNITHLQDATRIATNKVFAERVKVFLLITIAVKYAKYIEFKKALQTANKIPNILFRILTYIQISIFATIHGFLFAIRAPFMAIRALRDR